MVFGAVMSKSFYISTGCKINLYLHIQGKRPDGYHYLDSLFYPLPRPRDWMHIVLGPDSGLSLSCCSHRLEPGSNILHKVYEAFYSATGHTPGLKVYLCKNIPIGAGLGGGSADAAAFLLFLNSLSRSKRLSHPELISLAAEIGADIPFFLYHQPARVSGIGEKLSLLNMKLKDWHLLLICPEITIDTAWAYKTFDACHQEPCENPMPPFLTSSATKDNYSFFGQLNLYNSFEKAIFSACPELGRIKAHVLHKGATACVMSGSGSSLAAFFRSQERARHVALTLDRHKTSFYYIKL